MPGPPNVNPFAHDYAEKIRPAVDNVLENARPELQELADIYINRLPWFKRKIVSMAWWPIMMILINRLLDAFIETFLATSGAIRPENCSPSVRMALLSAPDSSVPVAIAGTPHLTREFFPGNPDPAEVSPDFKRSPKVIRTIDRGQEWFWSNGCKDKWVPRSECHKAKEFPCYEIAYTYYLEIPVVLRIGDPKIVNKDF